MEYDKRIVTHKWGNNETHDEFTSSNGFVIALQTYGRDMEFLYQMACEAKNDFSQLRDRDIIPFVITQSAYNRGMAGIRFSLPPGTTKEGYTASSELDFQHT